MNGFQKHVASRTPQKTTWNATLGEGDVAEEVARLKEMPGEGILKYGTSELDRTFIEHGPVDEFHFWIHPVAVGAGQHLFDGFDTTPLDLVHTTPFKSGVVVVIFSPK